MLSGDGYLIMVAGKQGGANPTTGLAQLSVAFQAADAVRFAVPTVQAVEGQTTLVQLSRAFIHRDPLPVEVQVTDPSGALTTQTLGSAIGGFVASAQITPPDDGVFTPGQSYALDIVGGAGLYTRRVGGFTCVVEVLDNDPIRLPATTFTGAFSGGSGPGGQITLSLGRSGGFTGKYLQGAVAKSFRGQIDAFGRAFVPLTLPGQPAVALEVALSFNTFSDQFQVATRLIGLDVLSPFLSPAIYSATNPAPESTRGRYSLSWIRSGGTSAGHGSLTVSPSGAVKGAGTLFDGTKFAFGTRLKGTDAASASAFAFARTHGGKGTMAAELTFPIGASQVQTFRPAGLADPRTSAFLAGYADAIGVGRLARYTLPAAGAQPSAGFTTTQGRGTFGLGSAMAPTDTVDFTLAPTGKATSATAGFTLKLAPKTGLYRGTRPNPTSGGKPVPFSGVLDQAADQGPGTGTGFGISHEPTVAKGAIIRPRP